MIINPPSVANSSDHSHRFAVDNGADITGVHAIDVHERIGTLSMPGHGCCELVQSTDTQWCTNIKIQTIIMKRG